MDFDLGDAKNLLARTPATLSAMLAGLPEAWVHANYAEDTFSPFDVVGHLIVGERTDWLVRTRIILEQGPGHPFPKYDRYAQFEQNAGRSIDDLLAEFAALRRDNLTALGALDLTPAALGARGTHPALGEVTLAQLLATWVAHDQNHVAQIARALASQYEGAVGPWRAYLGILKGPVTPMDAEGAARCRAAMAGVKGREEWRRVAGGGGGW